MDKLNIKHRKLLQVLLNSNKILSSKELSFETKISIRSVKNYIKIINESINKYDVNIKGIHSKGYRLEYKNIENIDYIKQNNIFVDDKYVNEYVQERVFEIIKILFLEKKVDSDYILNKLNISIHTFNKDIQVVKERFKRYRLNLKTKSNYFYICGSEMDIRLFLNDFINYSDKKIIIELDNYYGKYKIQKDILENILDEFNVTMSGLFIKDMKKHLKIGLMRYKLGYHIKLYSYETRWNLIDKESLYFIMAKDLAIKIKEEYSIELSYDEIMYYALHLKSKAIISNLVDEKVEFCILESFREIKNNFDIDFFDDKVLYNNLKRYIPSMIIRLKSHIIVRNNIISENLGKYLFATKIVHTVSYIIEKIYEIDMDINEFGVLVLYFKEALIRLEKKNNINIAILKFNNVDEIMYYNDILRDEELNKNYNIKYVEDYEKNEKIEMLIGTTNIISKCNLDYFIINSDNYLNGLKSYLKEKYKDDFKMYKYFKKEYFLKNMNLNSKNEVIKYIIDYLKNNNLLKINKTKFDFKSAELGKEVVHLQDLYKIIDKNICLILILKRSIFWEQSMARIIILTKTKRDGDKDLYKICELISKFISKNENIYSLIENQTFEYFIQILNS